MVGGPVTFRDRDRLQSDSLGQRLCQPQRLQGTTRNRRPGSAEIGSLRGDRHQRVHRERLVRIQDVQSRRARAVPDQPPGLQQRRGTPDLAVRDAQQNGTEAVAVSASTQRSGHLHARGAELLDQCAAEAAGTDHGKGGDVGWGSQSSSPGRYRPLRGSEDNTSRFSNGNLSRSIPSGDGLDRSNSTPEPRGRYETA